MDQGNITLNLATLLYQQSALFMKQIVDHSREVQDLILTQYTILPPDSDLQESQEQSEDDVHDQVKVEAQEYNQEQHNKISIQTEQGQQQLIYQLSNLKKARQNQDLNIGTPELIDGIQFIKDQIRTPVYIKCDVQQNQIVKQKQKQKQKQNLNKSSIKKKFKQTSSLQQTENNTKKKVKLDNMDFQKDNETKLKISQKSQNIESEDKIQTQLNPRQMRKLKSEQQKMNQNKVKNSMNPYKTQKILQQCQFQHYQTQLEDLDNDHGIINEKQSFSNDLQEKTGDKNEKSQQEQLQFK